MIRGRQLLVALFTVFALLTVTAATTATAKSKACKKGYVRNKAKKCVKKAVAKTTKKATATTVKTVRQISAPAGSTATTLKPRPTDANPDGELIISYAAPPNNLDPAKNSLTPFTYLLYDRLTTIDDSLNVKPMLATGWSFPNKSTFEMTLRNDVTFEDGTKFDAAAVKANIERSKTISGSIIAPLLKTISSVEVISPTVVQMHLTAGGTELPALFAQAPGEMISPKVIASGVSIDIGTRGGGSGPYTVDTITVGDRMTFKPSKMVTDGTYWDKAAGQLKKFTWIYLATSPQRINAVRSGDIDVGQVTGVDTYPAQQLVDKGELKGRHVVLQTTNQVMMLRNTRPPLDNLKFRQALQYAIDKQALAKGLYNGDCTPSSQFFTASHWAHSFAVDKRYTYDRDLAQKMIKDTGIFNPTFTAQYNPIYQAPAQALQGMFGDYGINMKIENVGTTDTSFRDGNADATVGAMSGQVDPTNVLNNFYLGVYKLYTDTDGSVTRDAAAAADPTISQAQAAKLFDGIWQKIAEQSVIVHLCNTHQVWVHKGKVANINDLGYTFSGLVDARYLYVRK